MPSIEMDNLLTVRNAVGATYLERTRQTQVIIREVLLALTQFCIYPDADSQ